MLTTKYRNFGRQTLALAIAVMLSACGGGGSSPSSTALQQGNATVAAVQADGSTITSSTPGADPDADLLASAKVVLTPAMIAANAKNVSYGAAVVSATKLKGVNIAGGEFNGDRVGARPGWDYVYPNNTEIDYYAARGMTVIRMPFSSFRLQPVNNAALNTTEVAYLQSVITYAASKGMRVILDPHDYGSMRDSASGTYKVLGVAGGLPAAVFADFWSRMALAFKAQPNVIFGLMNEPNTQTAAQWKAVALQAVNAIRATGASNLILIPGSAWTGGASWVSSGNAAAWSGFSDPGNNFAFELHQYLDAYNTGTTPTCQPGLGATALNAATLWARTNGFKLFLGEMGWAANATCLSEGAALMTYMTSNPDVWSGWTYWAGGAWWPADYMFLLRPDSFVSPVDKPQMTTLRNNL